MTLDGLRYVWVIVSYKFGVPYLCQKFIVKLNLCFTNIIYGSFFITVVAFVVCNYDKLGKKNTKSCDSCNIVKKAMVGS